MIINWSIEELIQHFISCNAWHLFSKAYETSGYKLETLEPRREAGPGKTGIQSPMERFCMVFLPVPKSLPTGTLRSWEIFHRRVLPEQCQ